MTVANIIGAYCKMIPYLCQGKSRPPVSDIIHSFFGAHKINTYVGSSSDVPGKGDKKNKISFIYMTPQHLLERKHIFEKNLLKITKTHHQEFLKKKNFPDVPDDKIVRWHPEFPVDSVPNIPIGNLPEEPDLKVCTARDVLNKLKGSVRGRVSKALQSVADEHEKQASEKKTDELNTKNEDKIKKQSSALKGICTDLLEKELLNGSSWSNNESYAFSLYIRIRKM